MARNIAENFARIGFSWACAQAAQWGWEWYYEGEMIWVKTGENEVGCSDRQDFISFVSEHNQEKAR
jgi:hypothetical protein